MKRTARHAGEPPAPGPATGVTDPQPPAGAPAVPAGTVEAAPRRWNYPRSAIILAGFGGATLAAFGIYSLRSFFAPFFLALILTICVHPVRRRMEGRGINRGVATGTVIAVVFTLLAAFVAALVVAFAQFAALLPQFGPQIAEIGQSITDGLAKIGFDPAHVEDTLSNLDPGRIIGLVSGLLGSVAGVATFLVIVLTTLIMMAMDANFLPTVMRQVQATKPGMVESMAAFAGGVRRYMVATTALGIAQGALNWVALLIMGVPGAFLWGLLAFLCSFIPNIGYFIAIIPPIIFGFFVGGWGTVIAVIIVYGVINAVVQSLIQPLVVGNAVSLSQTITFVSVLFWATIIGPIGAILAIPLTLLVRAMLVDSDPSARWWRPVIGDLTETKSLMKSEDAAAKDARRAKSAMKASAHTSEEKGK